MSEEEIIDVSRIEINEDPDINNDTRDLSKELLSAVEELLEFLSSDPESETIKWSTRIQDIEAFRKKIYNIYQEK